MFLGSPINYIEAHERLIALLLIGGLVSRSFEISKDGWGKMYFYLDMNL